MFHRRMRKALTKRGFDKFMDRFKMALVRDNGTIKNVILSALAALPPLAWLGQTATAGSMILAIKRS